MWEREQAGVALLEVLIALGLLAVSTLVIAESLGAAVEHARAAEAARRATADAAAVAATLTGRAEYPAGWRVVGSPGADGLPGTRDDDPPAEPARACERRIRATTTPGDRWAWIEVSCGLQKNVVTLVTAW